MSNISSNSLFHFTPNIENLRGILQNGFILRYSLEETKLDPKRELGVGILCAIPMVCFCDLSLSQISEHTKMYGSYGIGMTKEWGIKNKLNPIIYVNENSQLAQSFRKIFDDIEKLCKIKETDEHIAVLTANYINITKYLKPYQGSFNRNEKIHEIVRF